MSEPTIRIEPATLQDVEAISQLQTTATRTLSIGYSPAQVAAFLSSHGTVDRQLISDGTYLVARAAGRLSGCGGWSFRDRLFGGAEATDTQPSLADRTDPADVPARMRAFFVHPDFARQGIAARLLEAAEHAAARHGHRRSLLQATLAGRPLYAAHGYREIALQWIQVAGAPPLASYRMEKNLALARTGRSAA